MQSIKEIYKIGPGPSSSHTIAPFEAVKIYLKKFPNADSYKVTLYGSLAKTGVGHLTDKIIIQTFHPKKCEVVFDYKNKEVHPLFFTIVGYKDGLELEIFNFISLGGGDLEVNGQINQKCDVYQQNTFNEIEKYCNENKILLYDYVYLNEPEIKKYLVKVLNRMLDVVDSGLKATGILPGKLKLERVAKDIYLKSLATEDNNEAEKLKIMAFAYAASEENADGQIVVTSPTLGASGVLPALMKHYYLRGFSKNRLINALAIAGLIGNIVKTNATISGAIGGCQAEIGTACAMGSAAVAYLEGLDINKIEAAAEIGMEHHLGLTCDPVGGYVIIPCIERNAVAAVRALDAALLSKTLLSIRANRVNFDMVVETMKYTGNKIAIELKETALGGLATQIKIEE